MVKTNIKTILIIILIILLFMLGIGYLKERSRANDYQDRYAEKDHEFTEFVDKNGQRIATMEQIMVNDKKRLKELTDQVEGMTVNQQVKVVTKTVIKNDTIYLSDTLFVQVEGADFLRLPYSFNRDSEWYGYAFTIDRPTVIMDSLYFISKPVISWGWDERRWFEIFKPKELKVAYFDKNPFARVVDMENYSIREPKRRIRPGLFVGYGISKGGLSPMVGVGLTY